MVALVSNNAPKTIVLISPAPIHRLPQVEAVHIPKEERALHFDCVEHIIIILKELAEF